MVTTTSAGSRPGGPGGSHATHSHVWIGGGPHCLTGDPGEDEEVWAMYNAQQAALNPKPAPPAPKVVWREDRPDEPAVFGRDDKVAYLARIAEREERWQRKLAALEASQPAPQARGGRSIAEVASKATREAWRAAKGFTRNEAVGGSPSRTYEGRRQATLRAAVEAGRFGSLAEAEEMIPRRRPKGKR